MRFKMDYHHFEPTLYSESPKLKSYLKPLEIKIFKIKNIKKRK